jgi:2'-hydroxyisoflavone reductase
MRILVLGGTRFLGRHFVEEALLAGHEVTLFNRGKSGAALYSEAELLVGDRVAGDLSALVGHTWDAAIDTAGYLPNVAQAVRRAAEELKDSVEYYTFVSSIEVYTERSRALTDETAPVHAIDEVPPDEDTPDAYGIHKAHAEAAVTAAFGMRSLLLRAGLIVGPYDEIDRFPYFVRRVARGGEVLAPEAPTLPVQLIDGRDLAQWVYRMVEHGRAGTFNVAGPAEPFTLGRLLETCRDVSGSDASFTWVPGRFLEQHGVGYWHELPFWLPRDHLEFWAKIDVRSALREELRFRPLANTIRDTLEWDRTRPPGTQRSDAGGLDLEKERRILTAWRNAQDDYEAN